MGKIRKREKSNMVETDQKLPEVIIYLLLYI